MQVGDDEQAFLAPEKRSQGVGDKINVEDREHSLRSQMSSGGVPHRQKELLFRPFQRLESAAA
jgi:hypothetical protein